MLFTGGHGLRGPGERDGQAQGRGGPQGRGQERGRGRAERVKCNKNDLRKWSHKYEICSRMSRFGPRCAVRAIDVSDPTKVHEFRSLVAAKKAMLAWHQKNVGHTVLRKYAEKRQEAYGYLWELANNHAGIEDTQSEIASYQDCVQSIFQNPKIRNSDGYISVLDVIALMCETTNPRSIYQQLVTTYDEITDKVDVWQFPGANERETMATNYNDILYIVHLLPGKKAALFRKYAFEMLNA